MPAIARCVRTRAGRLIRVRDFLTDQRVFRAPDAPRAPVVSVVLPTYSRYRTGQLENAIASVLQQTLADLELIVVDDGSRDGSFDLLQKLQARDPRLVHVRHERNSGIHILRVNEGIALARGRYVAFQFDDDHWRPHALEVLVDTMRASSPGCVTVGKAEYTSRVQPGSFVLPKGGLSFTLLHEENRIANNALLVPRELFDRYGMYDCHIGMRRLCDWDLWMRLNRHVEFVLVDEIISHVSISNPGAIGVTVPWDLALFRCFSDIPRNALLTPDRWDDYEVDARRVGGVELAPEIWRRLYEEQIVPYYAKFRHCFPFVEGFPLNAPRERKEVLYFCSGYGPTNDVTLGLYDARASSRNTYKAHFQYGTQLSTRWLDESDMMLMVRPYREQERGVMEQGVGSGRPMGVYLDDDFLTLHEYGPPFDYMGPGTAGRGHLVAILEQADAVWVTSRFIGESVGAVNRRIVPHAVAIAEDDLPAESPRRRAGAPVRIGYVGTSYRLEEFRLLWEALVRLSGEYGERLEFEFWGLDVSGLAPLASPVRQVAYETSYGRFVRRLREARFDILLTPLLAQPRPRLAKNAHKYYHVAVAGALGIFSRVPPYEGVPEGLTCLKAENTAADWYRVVREAVEMPAERFDLMRRRTLAQVREEGTEAAQIHGYEAAWRATEFHAKTRGARGADGRPRVVYVVGEVEWEGEVRLQRWLGLVRHYGVEPVVVLRRGLEGPAGRLGEGLTEAGIAWEAAACGVMDEGLRGEGAGGEGERREVRAVLERWRPALVHSIGLLPGVGEVCAEMGLAHVASVYAVREGVQWGRAPGAVKHCAVNHADSLRAANQWREWLGSEKFCAREVVARESFDLGMQRHLEELGTAAPAGARGGRVVVVGTVREEAGQVEAIAAVAELVRKGLECGLAVWGDTEGEPEYVRRCRARIEAEGLGGQVQWQGAPREVGSVVASADIVLSPGRWGGFPLAIKEAMAVGAVVVATPVGGVPEIVIDGVTGIVCADTSVGAIAEGLRRALELSPGERGQMVEQARRVARSEFHPQRGASDLFEMYNRALELTRSGQGGVAGDLGAAAPRGGGERIEQPGQPPGSHVRVHDSLAYRLVPGGRAWHGVDVLVGTHQRSASGRLELTVMSAGGNVVRTASVELAGARDNEWVTFEFAPIANAAHCPFVLRFALAGAGPRTKVSLYDLAADGTARLPRALRRLGLSSPRDSLYCRMRYAQ